MFKVQNTTAGFPHVCFITRQYSSRNSWMSVLILVSVASQENSSVAETIDAYLPVSIFPVLLSQDRWFNTSVSPWRMYKIELIAFIPWTTKCPLLFLSIYRLISGGALPLQYLATLPAYTTNNSPSVVEILQEKPAVGFRSLALHNAAKISRVLLINSFFFPPNVLPKHMLTGKRKQRRRSSLYRSGQSCKCHNETTSRLQVTWQKCSSSCEFSSGKINGTHRTQLPAGLRYTQPFPMSHRRFFLKGLFWISSFKRSFPLLFHLEQGSVRESLAAPPFYYVCSLT